MKLRNLLITFSLTLLTIGFISCKKENNNSSISGELETTFELSGDQAIADNLTEDANNILMETSVEYDFSGERQSATTASVSTMNILSCATVTVAPLQGFPKNIVVDFGDGCISQNLVLRKEVKLILFFPIL